MAKKELLLTRYGFGLLLISILAGAYLIFSTMQTYYNNVTSTNLLYSILGAILVLYAGVVLLQLGKRVRNSILLLFVFVVLVLLSRTSYPNITAFGVVAAIILALIYFARNRSAIASYDDEIEYSTHPSNWFFRLAGLRVPGKRKKVMQTNSPKLKYNRK